jgi:hypothetical protein
MAEYFRARTMMNLLTGGKGRKWDDGRIWI